MKRIIVTGSAGFIGKTLVKRLKEKNLVLEFDIKEGNDAVKAIPFILSRKADLVIHLAAQTSVFNTDLWAIKKDNIDLFMGIALACQESGTRLIYASSSTANPGNTTSLYGISKHFNEEFARIYCPGALGLRFHNVYGDQPREGTLLWNLLQPGVTDLWNSGKNLRCYTWIEDIVEAIVQMSESNNSGLMNIVNEEPLTTLQFAELVKKWKPEIEYRVNPGVREKDNPVQAVDPNIPKVGLRYHKVGEVINIWKNECVSEDKPI